MGTSAAVVVPPAAPTLIIIVAVVGDGDVARCARISGASIGVNTSDSSPTFAAAGLAPTSMCSTVAGCPCCCGVAAARPISRAAATLRCQSGTDSKTIAAARLALSSTATAAKRRAGGGGETSGCGAAASGLLARETATGSDGGGPKKPRRRRSSSSSPPARATARSLKSRRCAELAPVVSARAPPRTAGDAHATRNAACVPSFASASLASHSCAEICDRDPRSDTSSVRHASAQRASARARPHMACFMNSVSAMSRASRRVVASHEASSAAEPTRSSASRRARPGLETI